MNAWLEWGIPVIVWVQTLGEGLLTPMRFLSFMGVEEFYLLVMPAILWCFDAGLGFRVGLVLLVSSPVNSALKQMVGWPRPPWVSALVRDYGMEASFGVPSGHAQNAIALWGRLAAGLRRNWATALLALIIGLISISRLYLGVHFPTDVLVGLAIGGILLWVFLRYEADFVAWMKGRSLIEQIGVALAAALAILALHIVISTAFSGRPIPAEWDVPAEFAPYSLKDAFAFCGALFGFAAGGAILFSRTDFDGRGPWGRRAARYALGVVGVGVIFFGLRLILPRGEDLLAQALRFLRYAGVGFWISYLAPALFQRLSLA